MRLFTSALILFSIDEFGGNSEKIQNQEFSRYSNKKSNRYLFDQNFDFQELDDILKQTSIHISRTEIEDLPFPLPSSSKLILDNVQCNALGLDDIQDTFDSPSRFRSKYNLEIKGLDLYCTFEWSFLGGAIGEGEEKGTGVISTEDNMFDTTMRINKRRHSWNDDNGVAFPPNSLDLRRCRVNLNFVQLRFDGGTRATVLNTINNFIGLQFQKEIRQIFCQQIETLTSNNSTDFLRSIIDEIDTFLETQEQDGILEDMILEQQLLLSSGENVIDFTKTDVRSGNLFAAGIELISQYFGGNNDNSNADVPTINSFLQTNYLDTEGVWAFDIRDYNISIPAIQSLSLEGMEDMDLTVDTNIEFSTLKISGLNTFTNFDILQHVGPQALESIIQLEKFKIELDILVDIKPYRNDDSIPSNTELEFPPQNQVVTASFEVHGISSDFVLILAIDGYKFDQIQIGSLLNYTNIFPCLASAITYSNISDASFFIDNYQLPSFRGLLSKGLDDIVNNLVTYIASTYGDMLEKHVLENFVMKKVREEFNTRMEAIMSDKFASCPAFIQTEEDTQFIDFRDVFLHQSDAIAVGASGQSLLGNSSSLIEFIDTFITGTDEYGVPHINENIIVPLTKAQSNVPGALMLENEIFSMQFPLSPLGIFDKADFQLMDFTIENLDTISYPIQIFSPRADEPNTIDNMVVLGTDAKPLRLSFELIFSTTGNENTSNRLHFEIELKDLMIMISLLAKIDEKSIKELSLSEASNLYCLISTIPSLSLDETGLAMENENYPSAAISYLQMVSTEKTHVKIDCVECSNDALNEIPKIINLLVESGTIDQIFKGILANMEVLMDMLDIQFQIDQIIQKAAMRCPSNPLYNDDKNMTGYNFSRHIYISKEILELGIFAASIIIQVSSIVMSYALSSDEKKQSDIGSDGSLDLTQSSTSIGRILRAGLAFVQNQFQNMQDDPTSVTGKNLGINILLRNYLLNKNNKYTLNLNNESASLSSSSIKASIDSIKIEGLDTVNRFDDFNLTSDSIRIRFGVDRLKILVSTSVSPVHLAKTSQLHLDDDSKKIMESLVFEVNLEEIDVDLNVLVRINETLLGEIELGNILHTDQVLPCLFSTTNVIEFTNINVTLGNYSLSENTGILSNIMREEIEKSRLSLLNEYEQMMHQTGQAFFDYFVRHQLNTLLMERISNATCPSYNSTASSGFVDFRDLFFNATTAGSAGATGEMPYGNLASSLVSFLHDDLAAMDTDGTSRLNEIIPDVITIPGDIIDYTQYLNESTSSINDVLSFRVFNLTISNTNSIVEPFKLLYPRLDSPFILDNIMLLGFGKHPISLKFNIVQVLGGDKAEMFNQLEVNVVVKNAELYASLFAKVNANSLLEFPVQYLDNPQCWLATVPPNDLPVTDDGQTPISNAALTNLELALNDFDITVTCISCSSTELENVANSITNDKDDATLMACVDRALNYTKEILLSNITQIRINRMLHEAAEKCPHTSGSPYTLEQFTVPDIENDALKITIALASIAFLFLVCLFTINCLVKKKARQKYESWILSLAEDELTELRQWNKNQDLKMKQLYMHTKALIQSEDIPRIIRYSIPCIVLVNVALFLSGHLSLGGSIIAHFEFAGEVVSIPNFFEFSIAETVKEMWLSGVKSLSVIIFVLSVFWPYLKQFITLFIWLLPPSRLSVVRRGFILNLLDSLGKWSIVDIYVLMLSMVGFRFSARSPDNHNIFPDNFYSLEVMLLPLWGLYANMIAQLISQLSSNVIVYYHNKNLKEGGKRLSFKDDEPSSDCESYVHDNAKSYYSESSGGWEDLDFSQGQDRTSLCQEPFQLSGHKAGQIVTLRTRSKVIIGSIGVFAIAVLIAGSIVPSFRIDISGVAAQLIVADEENQSTSKYYSVFGVVKTVIDQSVYLGTIPNFIGLGSFSILFICTTLITPLVLMVILLCIWFLPMVPKTREKLIQTSNILSAWQYLEVYIISIFMAMWQVGDISEIMVQDVCESLNQLFSSFYLLGILNEENARCFHASIGIETGFYMLLLVSVCINWLNNLTMKACEHLKRNFFVSKSNMKRRIRPKNNIDIQDKKTNQSIDLKNELKHVRVNFTDRFSWMFLISEVYLLSRLLSAELKDTPETHRETFDDDHKSHKRDQKIDVSPIHLIYDDNVELSLDIPQDKFDEISVN